MNNYKQIGVFPEKKADLSSIKQEIDNLIQDKAAKIGMRLGFSSLGLSLIILGVTFKKLPPEIPLWFSKPYGAEQLAPMWQLGLIPLASLIIQIISIKGAGIIITEDKLMSRILVWLGGIVGLMGLITIIQIVKLVT